MGVPIFRRRRRKLRILVDGCGGQTDEVVGRQEEQFTGQAEEEGREGEKPGARGGGGGNFVGDI